MDFDLFFLQFLFQGGMQSGTHIDEETLVRKSLFEKLETKLAFHKTTCYFRSTSTRFLIPLKSPRKQIPTSF